MASTILLLCAALAADQWLAPPSGGKYDDGFGRAVAVSNRLAVVGTPGASLWGDRCGDHPMRSAKRNGGGSIVDGRCVRQPNPPG